MMGPERRGAGKLSALQAVVAPLVERGIIKFGEKVAWRTLPLEALMAKIGSDFFGVSAASGASEGEVEAIHFVMEACRGQDGRQLAQALSEAIGGPIVICTGGTGRTHWPEGIKTYQAMGLVEMARTLYRRDLLDVDSLEIERERARIVSPR